MLRLRLRLLDAFVGRRASRWLRVVTAHTPNERSVTGLGIIHPAAAPHVTGDQLRGRALKGGCGSVCVPLECLNIGVVHHRRRLRVLENLSETCARVDRPQVRVLRVIITPKFVMRLVRQLLLVERTMQKQDSREKPVQRSFKSMKKDRQRS